MVNTKSSHQFFVLIIILSKHNITNSLSETTYTKIPTIMRFYIFIFFLLLFSVVGTQAQPKIGTIPFDCPDVDPPTFEFNLTLELIDLISSVEVYNSVENIYIHTYQKSDEVFDKLNTYYATKLLKNGWDKFTDDVNYRIHFLVNTYENNENVAGIFAIVRTQMSVYLLNIVGKIPQQQIGTLLANLNLLGIWIPELRSLGEQIDTAKPQTESNVWSADDTVLYNNSTTILRIFNESTKSLSKFSGTMQTTLLGDWTYNSHPISRIEIKSHTRSRGNSHQQRIDAIKDILSGGNIHQDGPADFDILLNRLLSSEALVYIQRITVDTDEKQIQLFLEEMQDDDHIKLSQQFRTQEDDPIHEIQLYGNLDFDMEILKSVLEEGPSEIDFFMKTLPDTFPEIDKATIETVDFGQQRIAKITVLLEKPIANNFYGNAIPRIGFNRVSGWELGARVETGFHSQPLRDSTPIDYDWNREVPLIRDNPKIFAQFGYGFGNKQRYYSIGGNQIWGKRKKWKIGYSASYQRAITTISSDIFAGYEERGLFLLRLIGVPDHQNYYLKKGPEMSFHWQPKWSNRVRITLASEKHENLHKTTDWHILNWRSTSKMRDNLDVTPANIRSITLKSEFNSRRNYLGWHNTFIIEHSNAVFGSDYDWTRAQTHFRYAYPFGRNQIRSRFVMSSVFGKKKENQIGNTLLPIQRQFIIGGIGTLNGYPINSFIGDEGYLFNVELNLGIPVINQIDFLKAFHAVLFVDIGQVWNEYRDKWNFEPKGSAGIGIQISSGVDIFRFNVAKAFDADQDIQYNLMFFYSY